MDDFSVPGDAEFAKLVEALADRLLAAGLKAATAESCTGGWIAKCCTDLAGSSAWFERGYVTYSNAAKVESLGVDAEILVAAGAVSREVAELMAEGACRRGGADVAMAVTGIAGPGGATPGKPLGTVWFAWAAGGGTTSAVMHFGGNRDAVRRQTVAFALRGLLDRLQP